MKISIQQLTAKLRIQGCAHMSMSRAHRANVSRMIQWNVNIYFYDSAVV